MYLLYYWVLYIYGFVTLLPRFVLLVIKGQFFPQNSCKLYSTIKKKEKEKRSGRFEYPAMRVTSFVLIVVYLTCTIML
jgi:hypothetical protein